jgi:hypothetical protein
MISAIGPSSMPKKKATNTGPPAFMVNTMAATPLAIQSKPKKTLIAPLLEASPDDGILAVSSASRREIEQTRAAQRLPDRTLEEADDAVGEPQILLAASHTCRGVGMC